MAPDFVGGTTGPWNRGCALPVEFAQPRTFSPSSVRSPSTSLTRSTAPPPLATARSAAVVDRDCRGMGNARLLGAVAGRPGSRVAHRSGPFGGAGGQMRKMSGLRRPGHPYPGSQNQGIWFTTRLRNVIAARSSSSSLPSPPVLSRARLSASETLRSPTRSDSGASTSARGAHEPSPHSANSPSGSARPVRRSGGESRALSRCATSARHTRSRRARSTGVEDPAVRRAAVRGPGDRFPRSAAPVAGSVEGGVRRIARRTNSAGIRHISGRGRAHGCAEFHQARGNIGAEELSGSSAASA